MRKPLLALLIAIGIGPVAAAHSQQYSPADPVRESTANRELLLEVVEPGMTFDEIVSLLGEPDETEWSYFIGSHTDAMRYGRYWLVSRRGQILDCVVLRQGFNRLCSRIGGGCESRPCTWYQANERPNVVMP